MKNIKGIVKLKLAKLAKEKGFNEPSIYRYNKNNKFELWATDLEEPPSGSSLNSNYHNNSNCVGSSAPTQSDLQKWLREKHNLHITVVPYFNSDEDVDCKYKCIYVDGNNNKGKVCEPKLEDSDYYKTYELALENALFEVLNVEL